jgi:hypothetical protein
MKDRPIIAGPGLSFLQLDPISSLRSIGWARLAASGIRIQAPPATSQPLPGPISVNDLQQPFGFLSQVTPPNV